MNTTKNALMISLLACAGLAGSAMAQDAERKEKVDERRELKGDFEKPLARKSGGESSVTMMMSQADGDNTTTLKVENGKISAELNGKKVPQDRIRKSDGKIEILDEHGEVAATFNMNFGGGDGEEALMFRFDGPQGQRGMQWKGQRDVIVRGPDGKPRQLKLEGAMPKGVPGGVAPKVMIGINMSDADPRLMEHLGLGERGGVLIDTVVEGLPAEKAGLQQHDLIVAVEGKSPITQDQLREVLREKKAGEELRLKIVRKGSPERDVVVKLEAFSPEKLGIGLGGGPGAIEMQELPEGGNVDVQKSIEEAMKQLHGLGGNEKLSGEIHKHLEEAMKQLKNQNFDWRAAPEGMAQLRLFDGKGGHWIVPGEGAEADGRVTEQLDRLSSQLEKLNERLERLEKRLNENKPAR